MEDFGRDSNKFMNRPLAGKNELKPMRRAAAGGGFAPVGARARAPGVARLKNRLFGFCNATSVMIRTVRGNLS